MSHIENIKKLTGGKVPSEETIARYIADNIAGDLLSMQTSEQVADIMSHFKVDTDAFVATWIELIEE